ncbi:substrate-binding domain-containing protein [bacterium]|nr:substrate-binding domain-containing protein [bacterium]
MTMKGTIDGKVGPIRNQRLRLFSSNRSLGVECGFLSAFLVLSIAGIVLFQRFSVLAETGRAGEAARTWLKWARILSVCGVTGSISTLVLIFFAIRRTLSQPFAGLVRTVKTAGTDLKSMSDAMSKLAQGNFSRQLALKSQTLPDLPSTEMNRLAESFNLLVGSLNDIVHEFNSITEVPCLRLCFVGGDVYLQGRLSGETMGNALTGGKGEVAVFTGYFDSTGQELRRKGFQSLLSEKYPEIKIVEVAENREDPELAYRQTLDLLKRRPGLSGIYITEGATPQGVARAVLELKKSGAVTLICHDMTDETMLYVKQGVITATIGDNAFAQGHDPVIHLYNHLVTGWMPETPRLLIDMDVVTRTNFHHFWGEGTGLIQSHTAMERLAKPADARPEKPLRIAVIGCENSSFWFPVRDGALAAAGSLKSLNTEVRWIAPKQDLTAEVVGPIIQSLMDEGVDGIAVVIEQRELVPAVNRAVHAGIPVISFITEPVSLKGLLFTITEQADRLMDLSRSVSGSAARVSAATSQINDAMKSMAAGAVTQDTHVNSTKETLHHLLQNINRVSRESKSSADAVERTSRAVLAGTDAMGKTMTSMKNLEESVARTWQIMDELGEHSSRIDSMVGLIKDIASRVNVLALNAVIEATQAGEYGRGFMVVANEIRKLAGSTRESTREITDMIHLVKSDIDQIGKVMSDGLERIRQSAGMTDEAVKLLNNIRQYVQVDRQRMTQIAESMTQMQSFSQKVDEAMEKVAQVSGKNAATAEEVNQSTVDMGSQLEEVSRSAQLLEGMARTEQQLLARLDLSGGESS